MSNINTLNIYGICLLTIIGTHKGNRFTMGRPCLRAVNFSLSNRPVAGIRLVQRVLDCKNHCDETNSEVDDLRRVSLQQWASKARDDIEAVHGVILSSICWLIGWSSGIISFFLQSTTLAISWFITTVYYCKY